MPLVQVGTAWLWSSVENSAVLLYCPVTPYLVWTSLHASQVFPQCVGGHGTCVLPPRSVLSAVVGCAVLWGVLC